MTNFYKAFSHSILAASIASISQFESYDLDIDKFFPTFIVAKEAHLLNMIRYLLRSFHLEITEQERGENYILAIYSWAFLSAATNP